jgi:hypothetical protein
MTRHVMSDIHTITALAPVSCSTRKWPAFTAAYTSKKAALPIIAIPERSKQRITNTTSPVVSKLATPDRVILAHENRLFQEHDTIRPVGPNDLPNRSSTGIPKEH